MDRTFGARSNVIENEDEVGYIAFSASVASDTDDLISNRTEGCSVVAILTVVTALAKYYDIKDIPVSVFCDNDEALRHRNIQNYTYSKLASRDVDIKLEGNEIMI